MAVKHYYCGKVCFNCIITVQNIKTYFNQSHKLLAIHTFLQHKFGHTVSETSLELQQFCLLLLCCETYYIFSGLVDIYGYEHMQNHRVSNTNQICVTLISRIIDLNYCFLSFA